MTHVFVLSAKVKRKQVVTMSGYGVHIGIMSEPSFGFKISQNNSM